ncbi:hypothetical protein PIB30_117976 [Stylosanthes scabra]|uniref:Uncharacterized protein n=1 Tax=Stylosanthes scabra TaxID=79078 RepID=A0ABU6YVZ8_9FABA|nr:hypothetical protein [Stylosanthes scabra]
MVSRAPVQIQWQPYSILFLSRIISLLFLRNSMNPTFSIGSSTSSLLFDGRILRITFWKGKLHPSMNQIQQKQLGQFPVNTLNGFNRITIFARGLWLRLILPSRISLFTANQP